MIATQRPLSRNSLMVAMTQWRSMLGGLILILVFFLGLGCSPAETALPLSSAETVEAAPVPLAGSSDLGVDESSGLGAFPAFLPPVAVGTDS